MVPISNTPNLPVRDIGLFFIGKSCFLLELLQGAGIDGFIYCVIFVAGFACGADNS